MKTDISYDDDVIVEKDVEIVSKPAYLKSTVQQIPVEKKKMIQLKQAKIQIILIIQRRDQIL